MAEQAVKEPSMEEILSTIRRIISEDGEGAEVAASVAQAAVNDEEQIDEAVPIASEAEAEQFFDELESLDAFDETAPLEDNADQAFAMDSFDAPEAFAEDEAFEVPTSLDEFGIERPEDISFEETLPPVEEMPAVVSPEDSAAYEDTSFEDAAEPSFSPSLPLNDITPETNMAANAAYQETVLTEDKTADAAAGALGKLISSMKFGEENTIEGLVREMLKPMIKDWLDANLPSIVEDKVEAEVQRIAKMVR